MAPAGRNSRIGNRLQAGDEEFGIALCGYSGPAQQLRIGFDGLDNALEGWRLANIGEPTDCITESGAAVAHEYCEITAREGQLSPGPFALDAEKVGGNLRSQRLSRR